MSRTAFKLAAAASSIVFLAACNDASRSIVGLTPTNGSATVVTPSGTLDQNISSLLGLFTGNGALAQWKNVKRKYADGQSDPQQLVVAKQMLVNLVDWVNKHSAEMSTPPAGETRDAAAARAILYMSEYVYNGPTFTPPAYTPAADVAVTIVSPTSGDTVVTPGDVAGIGLEAGSVAEPTIIVVTQNPTPYPANCSGPLQTKLCQYPRFYKFDQFPHVKLLKPAKISVCHVNGGSDRTPLADHDRFRLAHTLPANAADYTPGGTIRNTGGEAVEILPLVTQTFVNCGDVEMTAAGLRHTGGVLTRLARSVKKFFLPTTAYAIDQGFGGGTLEFSDFNDVDPQGVPEKSVESAAFTGPYYEGGTATVTYKIKNTGTATSGPVPVVVRVSPDTAFDGSDPTLATTVLPSIVPGDSVTQTVSFVIPSGIATGPEFIGIQVPDDSTLSEADLTNNKTGSWVNFEPAVEKAVTFFQASPGPYHAGDHVSVNFRAKNNGAGTAASVPVKVIISPDTVFDPTDITVVSVPSAVIPGHDSVGQVIGFVIPPTVGIGSRFMGIEMGNDPVHPEGNLGNNKAGVFASFQAPFVSLNNDLSVGEATVCAIAASGATYCYGDNNILGAYKQYGTTQPASNSPVTVAVPPAAQFARGHSQHKCAITFVGNANCWGRGGFGQLGRGIVEPTGNAPALVGGGISWASITTSRLSSCGVSTTGAGYCWGSNQHGEVGSTAIPVTPPAGPQVSVTTPHLIDGGHVWKSVVAGWLHACGIDASGLAWCWGANDNGQLGIAPIGLTTDTVNYRTPQPVFGGLHWIQLATGSRQTCGITVDHLAYCWGENGTGQLGDGSFQVPKGVPTLVGSPGMHFSLIAPASGFGDGSSVPTPPGLGQGNVGSTCALSERGEAYCWGWNGNGALGDGTLADHYTPMPVGGGHLFTNLQVGGSAACGKWFNQIWCWGSNSVGQLGNGTFVNASLPSLVGSPFNVP